MSILRIVIQMYSFEVLDNITIEATPELVSGKRISIASYILIPILTFCLNQVTFQHWIKLIKLDFSLKIIFLTVDDDCTSLLKQKVSLKKKDFI